DELKSLRAALSGRYILEREVGRGGMATVWLAQDLKHHRAVALKVLRSDVASALTAERFLREIAIAAQLTHPHILPLFDSGRADGQFYYVMPYVEGETLRQRLDVIVEQAIAKALAKAPADRWCNGAEFLAALSGDRVATDRRLSHGLHRPTLVALGVALAVVVGAALLRWLPHTRPANTLA